MSSLGSWLPAEPARFPVLLAVLASLNILALAAIGGVADAVVVIPVAVATLPLVMAHLNGRET